MNPNDNQNQQFPVDYLDQISANTSKKKPFISLPILIGIIAALLVACILTFLTSVNSDDSSITRLAARLTTTTELYKSSVKYIKSNRLSATNSELNIYLTNTLRDIDPILAKSGKKANDLDKNLLESESVAKTIEKLEDARLNAVYDRTYSSEMNYRTKTILTLINKIHKNTNSAETKKFLKTAYQNLSPIQKSLADFNTDSSSN